MTTIERTGLAGMPKEDVEERVWTIELEPVARSICATKIAYDI